MTLAVTQASYRHGACHDPQHRWIKSQYIYTKYKYKTQLDTQYDTQLKSTQYVWMLN